MTGKGKLPPEGPAQHQPEVDHAHQRLEGRPCSIYHSSLEIASPSTDVRPVYKKVRTRPTNDLLAELLRVTRYQERGRRRLRS